MTIGERIKQYRIDKGWSQAELARRMGYTDRSTICLVEKGKSDLTTSSIVKYANVFGVTPTEIMGWGKPVSDEDLAEIEYVYQDDGLRKMLMEFVAKLKAIKDSKDSLPT